MSPKNHIGKYEVKILRSMKNEWNGIDWFEFCIGLLVLSVLTLVFVCCVCFVKADDRVDFCFIQLRQSASPGAPDVFYIHGNVPWGDNIVLGYEYTQEAANKTLAEICPVK